MNANEEPPPPEPPHLEPTHELLLAQALDACIRAERRAPGSARAIIVRQPAWARPELRKLLELALRLDALASQAVVSDEFRAAARARLMERIGGQRTSSVHQLRTDRLEANGSGFSPVRSASARQYRWMRRVVVGLFAAVVGLTAVLSTSASSLARAELREVLALAERGRALLADPRAIERALDLPSAAVTQAAGVGRR